MYHKVVGKKCGTSIYDVALKHFARQVSDCLEHYAVSKILTNGVYNYILDKICMMNDLLLMCRLKPLCIRFYLYVLYKYIYTHIIIYIKFYDLVFCRKQLSQEYVVKFIASTIIFLILQTVLFILCAAIV